MPLPVPRIELQVAGLLPAEGLGDRLDAERVTTQEWTVRGGYAYSSNPLPTESLSPTWVDGAEHRAAVGATWARLPWRVDGAAELRLVPSRSTEGLNPDGYDGTYRRSGFGVALSVNYVF